MEPISDPIHFSGLTEIKPTRFLFNFYTFVEGFKLCIQLTNILYMYHIYTANNNKKSKTLYDLMMVMIIIRMAIKKQKC